MDYLIPIIAVNSGIKFAVTIALIVRYIDTRERVILLWGLGWLFFSLHSFFELFIVYTGKDIFYFLHHTVWALVAVPFIIATGEEKRSPHLWHFAASLVAIIGITSSYVGVYIISKWYPSIIIPSILNGGGFLLCAAGIKRRSVGSHILFWGFLLNGLHNLDYPFLRNVAGFAPIGFSLCILFALIFAVGFIMLSTEKLKKKMEDRAKMTRELNGLSKAGILVMETGIEKVLGFIVARVTVLTSAGGSCISLINPDGKTRTQRVCYGETEKLEGKTFPKYSGVHGAVIKSGKPIIANQFLKDKRVHRKVAMEAGLKSAVIVPLKIRDRVIGTLSAFNRDSPFTQYDIGLLSRFASYTAIAIENARLYDSQRQRIEAMDMIRVITEILISEREVDKLLSEVAKKSAGIFSAPATSIMLWDERRKNLVIKAGKGLSKDYIRRQKVPREKIDPLPIEPLTTENLQKTPFGNLELVKKEGLVSCLSLPLITSDEVIGILNIYSKGGIREFTKDEITSGNVIASYIAIAIKNGMLYENLKKNVSDLERFHKLAVGRELTMLEMQKNMEEIEKELAKYRS